MNMILKRADIRSDGIFGRMTSVDGLFSCFTLERAYPDKKKGFAPKIPAGSYKCQRRVSPHFGYELFELIDVPGHDFIEIHIANWQDELNGCVAVGEGQAPSEKGQMLTKSGDAFKRFMELQDGVESFYLTVLS